MRNDMQTRDWELFPLRMYTVVQGDSLRTIAAVHGTHWADIWNVNKGTLVDEAKVRRFTDPEVLLPGDQLVIPRTLLCSPRVPMLLSRGQRRRPSPSALTHTHTLTHSHTHHYLTSSLNTHTRTLELPSPSSTNAHVVWT